MIKVFHLNKKSLRDYYEQQASFLTNHQAEMYCVDDPLGNQRLVKIMKSLRHMQVSNMLDAGCAEGFYLRLFHSLNPKGFGVGIDISRKYLIKAKRGSSKGEYVLADIEYLPFRSFIFEVVLCSEVLEHVLNPKDALKELVRVSSRFVMTTTPSHTLPYYAIQRFDFFCRLAIAKNLLLSADPFKTLGLGGGHINIIEIAHIGGWSRKMRCQVVEARVLYTVGAPASLPQPLLRLINALTDIFVNFLPMDKRKGAIHFVLIEKNHYCEGNERINKLVKSD